MTDDASNIVQLRSTNLFGSAECTSCASGPPAGSRLLSDPSLPAKPSRLAWVQRLIELWLNNYPVPLPLPDGPGDDGRWGGWADIWESVADPWEPPDRPGVKALIAELAPNWAHDRKEAQPGYGDMSPPRYARNAHLSDCQLDTALMILGEETACRQWVMPNHPRNNCGLPLAALRELIVRRLPDWFAVNRMPSEKQVRSALRANGWHLGNVRVRHLGARSSAPGGVRYVPVWWPDRPDAMPLVGLVTYERWHRLLRAPMPVWPPWDRKEFMIMLRRNRWSLWDWQRERCDPSIELYRPPLPYNANP